jgi:L-ascorbate metabolism protein UlaG (beta-lactamase superfamily)
MISPDATISTTRSETDPLMIALRPFISRIAGSIRVGSGLAEGVDLAAREFPDLTKHFLIEDDLRTFGLKREFLFPQNDTVNKFCFHNRRTGAGVEVKELTPEEVKGVGNTMEMINTADSQQIRLLPVPYPELIAALEDAEIVVDQPSETDWRIVPGKTGIIRLQHASFLVQTQNAGILVDPHFVSNYSTEIHERSLMLAHLFNRQNVSAIAITHSHTDHYDLASLMMMPRETPIIVPKASGYSILCPEFATELRAIGFENVIEQDWYSDPVEIEDIKIWTFPFYGEQPLRYEYPRDRLLRNTGNSYVFETAEFSAWCLIDSGSDATGSMVDVAESIRNRFGKIDAVLSNLHEFFVGVGWGNPFYTTGGGEYWLSLTANQISRFLEMGRDMITLGPEGVSRILEMLKPGMFLPYAHLWSNIGTVPADEPEMLQSLRARPAFQRSGTTIAEWRIGDIWQP